ncbi:hypothetical protein SEVIR_6G258700v4 [Setaria viridis]|uniref:F-box domain-containing protein n=2 Tax=Setaria TaxID=4554 RepID=K3YI36_SETIT|nr:F-box/kelch-repeat protein At3g24760 [Setaria italica]XP_034601394.1 F-box/kelch-repeat protein At3g24760 [Setaria viridis]RCV32382.1 hypothetical protein SETIT_6G254200v2 [Setaria italica]TKW11842.1 hypothetical protein SEVIR_6G258700v2 [Setaria viridis]
MTMSEWDRHGLGWDLTELILSKLPLRSMVRASAVCRAWRDVLLAHHHHHHHRPWLFLHGHNNVVPRLGRTAFAYDPAAPDSWVSFSLPPGCFAGAGGFAFASPSPSRLAFAPLLREGDAAWRHAPTLASSRCSPVVAALPSSSTDTSSGVFLVVGGARFVGGLVDIEDGRLPTELYHHDVDTSSRWEQCAPLPAEFGSSSSLCLSSAVVGAGRFFFVYGTYSCTVSAFDLSRRAWTPARELRPAPGLVAAFLASGRGGRRLLLAGVDQGGAGAFGVWDVDPETLAARKIGEMPPELRELMMSISQEDVAVRCVGEDGLLYVVSDEQHRAYPACACEVVGDGGGDRLWCRWSKLPPLPVAGSSALISRFHKMVAFCSPVLLRHHLVNLN